eukprot:CAMPEP_0174696060 /NCGR_PEP_ID=MMETSP1094-20130205/2304_1 /TAXON_ID=156173 /ORGANISM="Chrysochromulina brevifilum, Strain UTEX LB 985" /LENGTH=300 /DNA_ID=CAMNT_0015892731 /DNA_START=33 /DNA_END=932 /DNA_ORIENTATION=+
MSSSIAVPKAVANTKVEPTLHITKSLTALAALTQDILRDVTNSSQTEAFTALAEEIDSAVGRLADGYMTLKLHLALSSTPEANAASLSSFADAEAAPPTAAPGPSLEQLLFPGTDNSLLDAVLAQETAGSLNLMDSTASPTDDLLCNTPLEPDRLHSDHSHSSDTLGSFGTCVLLAELSDSIFTVNGPASGLNEGIITPDPNEHAPPYVKRSWHEPSAERLRSWHEEGGTNLRALLASLHTVAPPGSACKWEKTPLSQLISDSTVQRAYKRSLLAVHPDKLPPPQREVGQQIFDTLRDAW